MICPGRGEEGAAVWAAIWPQPGNWAVKCGWRVRVRCQNGSIRAVCEQMFCGVFPPTRLRREDVSISVRRLSREQQTLTLRLPHVSP